MLFVLLFVGESLHRKSICFFCMLVPIIFSEHICLLQNANGYIKDATFEVTFIL